VRRNDRAGLLDDLGLGNGGGCGKCFYGVSRGLLGSGSGGGSGVERVDDLRALDGDDGGCGVVGPVNGVFAVVVGVIKFRAGVAGR
jgi:hypothetical protein